MSQLNDYEQTSAGSTQRESSIDDLHKILDKRYSDYLSGKVKMVTPEESRGQINELLLRKFN